MGTNILVAPVDRSPRGVWLRAFRIELDQNLECLHETNLRFFCGSSAGSRPEYRAAAEEMGARLWREKLKIGSWVSFA
jgi:hypothetical protein